MTKPKKIHYSYNGTLSVCGIDITKSRLEPILWLHAIERFDTFKVQSPKRVCKRCKKILLKVTDEMLDDVVDKKPIDFERITTEERDGMVNFESVRIQGLPSIAQAAIKTLENLGYTYKGAELWKPPIGKKPGLNIIGKGLIMQTLKRSMKNSQIQRLQFRKLQMPLELSPVKVKKFMIAE